MLEDRPFLVWSGRIEQEDFPKKKKTLRGTLGNSPAAADLGCGGYRAQILSTGWGGEARVHTRDHRHSLGGMQL